MVAYLILIILAVGLVIWVSLSIRRRNRRKLELLNGQGIEKKKKTITEKLQAIVDFFNWFSWFT